MSPMFRKIQSVKGSSIAIGYCDLTSDDDPITRPAWFVYTLSATTVRMPRTTERRVMGERWGNGSGEGLGTVIWIDGDVEGEDVKI